MILRKTVNYNDIEYIANLPQNNNHIAEHLINHDGNFPVNLPIEIHPYSNDFLLGEYNKYIIGTFPPISYIYNHPTVIEQFFALNRGPKIPFYHGNDATLWNSFLNIQETMELMELENGVDKKNYLIQVLNNSEINYADIIKSCTRSNINSVKDSDLYNLVINQELIEHILSNHKENIVLNFNTSSIFNSQNFNLQENGFLSNDNVQSLNLFIRALQEKEYRIQISLNLEDYHNLEDLPIPHSFKVFFKMRIIKDDYSKDFLINTTPSPSGNANRGLGSNLVYQNWFQNQPLNVQQKTPTKHFRKDIYQFFRNNNWEELHAMNI